MSYPTIQACLAANPTMTVLVNADDTYSPIDPPTVAETNECNRGLGYFHDNQQALLKAAAYLLEAEER